MKSPIVASTLTTFTLMLLLPCAVVAQDPAARVQDPQRTGDYRIEAMAAYWSTTADIIVSSDAPGVPGTRIDFRSDLDVDQRGFPELQVLWRPGSKHRFRFQYIPIHF